MSSLISPPVVSFYSYNGQDQKKGQTFLKLFLIIFDSYLVNGLPLSCATFLWYNLKQEKHEAIGTIEVFHRSANDNFNHVGVLRLDLKSEYETSEEIFTIMNLIVPPTFDLFECEEIITKVPVYAVERIEAMKRVGFKKSTKLLVGTMDGYAYKDYWTINR